MSESNSYRRILQSTSIIGGASVINIVVGLLRIKVAALLLGPAGVGLIGLLTNVVGTATALVGLGVGNVGTRQIAEAAGQSDTRQIWWVRRALFWLTVVLATVGGGLFWMLRRVLAEQVLGDASMARPLGWLSVAVALSVAAASQNALLNGMRRIGDIARLSVGSAVLSTVCAVAVLWWLGIAGIVIFVLAAPLANFLLGHWYVARLPRTSHDAAPLAAMTEQWRAMLKLGFAFMVAGLAGTIGQLAIRALIQRELGAEALGHFQAAWMISMTYIGFVLGAMGTDYYPHLTAVINDRTAVNRLVNEQTEVAMLLAAPVLLAMLALAPWVIRLLYSAEFVEATEILRWQVMGDILKIASWPLGFILLASGAGKAYMATEWLAMAVFLVLAFVLLPIFGIVSTGLAFFAMYVCYLTIVWQLAVRRTGFSWTRDVKRHASILFINGLAIHGMAWINEWIAGVVGIVLAIAWGLVGVRSLKRAGALNGRIGRIERSVVSMLGKFGLFR